MSVSTFTQVHASGRFDADLDDVQTAWDEFRDRPGVKVITATEHGTGDHDAAFKALGWDHCRKGECVVAWDAHDFELAWQPSLTLIGTAYFRGGNEKSRTKLLSVPLRHLPSGRVVMVRVAHMPAHIQAGDGFRKTTARVIRQAAAWSTGLAAWGRKSRRFARRHHAAVEIGVGDFNVNFHSKHWRTVVSTGLGMRCAGGKRLPKGGDLGKRLVSWAFVRQLEVDATAVLHKTPASDHAPIAFHYSIKHKEH